MDRIACSRYMVLINLEEVSVKSNEQSPDKVLYWLEKIDDYVVIFGLLVAAIGFAVMIGVLLRPIVTGAPF